MKFKNSLFIFAVALLFSGCSLNADDPSDNKNNLKLGLYYTLNTPFWEGSVDCKDYTLGKPYFPALKESESNIAFSFTSASTFASFSIAFPKDSIGLMKGNLLKKYKVAADGVLGANYDSLESKAFVLAVKHPENKGVNNTFYYSVLGNGVYYYNQINSITYLGRNAKDNTFADFIIEGEFKAKLERQSAFHDVFGDYRWKIVVKR